MKNRIITLAALGAALLSSCYQSQHEVPEEGALQHSDVYFSLSCIGVTEGEMTRAVTIDEPTQLIVFDKFDGKVTSVVAESTSSITLPLGYGDHDLYFVASAKEWSTVKTEELKMEWGNGLRDMTTVWALHASMTVSGSSTRRSIELPLIASCLAVSSSDYSPSNFAKYQFSAPRLCRGLDLTKMKGYVVESQPVAFALTGSSNMRLNANLYSLVPTDGQVGDITITTEGNPPAGSASTELVEITQRTMEDVTVQEAKVYNYTGLLFSADTTLPLTYTTSWSGEEDKTF